MRQQRHISETSQTRHTLISERLPVRGSSASNVPPSFASTNLPLISSCGRGWMAGRYPALRRMQDVATNTLAGPRPASWQFACATAAVIAPGFPRQIAPLG